MTSRQRRKGRSRTNALMLFGVQNGRKMETAEDRELIARTLERSSDPKMKELARRALDPTDRGTSFALLIEREKMNFHHVADEYKALMKAEGWMRQAQHLPVLMEQTALDAMSRDEKCRACKGTGKVERKGKDGAEATEVECDKCDGTGTKYVLGDIDRLKLVFEAHGITGARGAGVNVNLDLRKQEPGETMEDLSRSVSSLLEGEGGIVK